MNLESTQRRDRKLIWLSAVLFAVAGAIFAPLFLVQHQASKSGRSQMHIVRASESDQDAMLIKAKLLRDKWKSWAFQHQEELKELAEAKTSDTATLMRVYENIPVFPLFQGTTITLADLKAPPFEFTWNAVDLHPHYSPQFLADAKMVAADQKANIAIKERQQQNFTKYHDIALSDSANPGDRTLTLWISGRITQATYDPGKDHKNATAIDDSHEELIPKYDFLK